MSSLTRRGILGALTASTAVACAPKAPESFSANTQLATGLFSHGIASGDPLSAAVILWTRITPDNPMNGPIEVIWEMDKEADFVSLAASGTVNTTAAKDWTVKVDAKGLEAGESYYYRFRIGDIVSPIGQTKTLPKGSLDKARFAVVSCANWQHGFLMLMIILPAKIILTPLFISVIITMNMRRMIIWMPRLLARGVYMSRATKLSNWTITVCATRNIVPMWGFRG